MNGQVLRDHVSLAAYGSVRGGASPGHQFSVITPANLDGVSVVMSNTGQGRQGGEADSEAVLHRGDILVSARGSVGKVAMAGEECVGCAVSANILVLRLKDSLLPAVLWAFFNSAPGRKALEASTLDSSGQKAISFESLLSIKLQIPPMSAQQAIAEVVENGLKSHRAALGAVDLRLKLLRSAFTQVFSDNGGGDGNA